MKVEIKNLKHNSRMSEETDCFSADLWINGKKAAYVENTGKGGSHSMHFTDPAIEREFNEWAEAQPPLPDTGYGPLAMSGELFISILVGDLIDAKQKKKDEARQLKWEQANVQQFLNRGFPVTIIIFWPNNTASSLGLRKKDGYEKHLADMETKHKMKATSHKIYEAQVLPRP
jgi:hypothetical protein